MLELLYHREVMQWVEAMERDGYSLATKPSPPAYRICPDPMRPKGTRWVVVEARFLHHGPLGVIRDADMQQFREYRESIGAGKVEEPAGVGRWLASMPEAEAEAAVERARPAKERDDDFD